MKQHILVGVNGLSARVVKDDGIWNMYITITDTKLKDAKLRFEKLSNAKEYFDILNRSVQGVKNEV